MKKRSRRISQSEKVTERDQDTMRTEYDFSGAVRGATAARYLQGTNVVVLDPDVSALFPDSSSVNEALRTFARLVKPRRARVRRRKT